MRIREKIVYILLRGMEQFKEFREDNRVREGYEEIIMFWIWNNKVFNVRKQVINDDIYEYFVKFSSINSKEF